uniref:Uncharacterized protein n=1 Tax=Steinernema glaseri TaxID=37863 RepID=A0A1I7YDA2_9BILA
MQALECFDRRVWRHREEKEGEGFLSEESARKTERRAPIGSTSSLPAVRVKKDHWGQMAAGSARPIAEASRRHRLGAASCSPPQNKCPENTTTNVYGEEGETGRSQGGIIEKALFYDFALRVGATSVYDVAPSKVVVSLKRDTSPARGSASCYQSREHESHELPDRAICPDPASTDPEHFSFSEPYDAGGCRRSEICQLALRRRIGGFGGTDDVGSRDGDENGQ